MHIALDISPIKKDSFHRVRGTGFYTKNLQDALLKYFPEQKYTFFIQGDKITENVDIVHYPYFEPFFLTLPIFKKHKTVVTVHDLTPLVFPQHFQSGLKGKIKWQIQKALLKNTDAIITDSNCSKKDIVNLTGIDKDKIHVIYLAAGEEFRQLKIENLKLKIAHKYKLPKKFALYVGDVTWNKNLPSLIKAIGIAKIPLVMVGRTLVNNNFDKTNPWNQDLIEVQKLISENKNIICTGFVSSEDLVTIYNMATLLVMPSLYEGFGLPILEAMQSGCPVITSKEGSIPEIAGNAVYYVDAYSINSISQGIHDLYVNINLQKDLSQKGLLQANRFSWKKTAKETIQVYEKKN